MSTWEQFVSSLSTEEWMKILLGLRRYTLWVEMGRPGLGEFYSKEKQAPKENQPAELVLRPQ